MQIAAVLEPKELIELVPVLNEDISKVKFKAASALDLKAHIKGDSKDNTIGFSLSADPKDSLTLTTPYGTFYQPEGERVVIDGTVQTSNDAITLPSAKLTIGDSALTATGSVKFSHLNSKADEIDFDDSAINLQLRTEKPTDVYKLVSLIYPTASHKAMKGTISGAVHVRETVAQPEPSGWIATQESTCSDLDIYDMNGRAHLPDITGNKREAGKVQIASMKYKKLPIKNFNADIMLSWNGPDEIFTVNNGKADVAGGTAKLGAVSDLAHHKYTFTGSVEKIKSGDMVDLLFEQPGEITGLTLAAISRSPRPAKIKSSRLPISPVTGN